MKKLRTALTFIPVALTLLFFSITAFVPQIVFANPTCSPPACADDFDCVDDEAVCNGETADSCGVCISPGGYTGEGINTQLLDDNYVTPFIDFINELLVPAIMALALLVFLWGVFKYFILGAANEEDRKSGRQFVLWGIIGFAVILSVWGLVNLVLGVIGIDPATEVKPDYPLL